MSVWAVFEEGGAFGGSKFPQIERDWVLLNSHVLFQNIHIADQQYLKHAAADILALLMELTAVQCVYFCGLSAFSSVVI